MNLDCPRKEFFEAVSAAAAASSIRTSVNILQSLKIEARDGAVRVLGCDGEMWVERSVAGMVTEDGAVCLPAKTLTQILSQLPDGDLHLESLESGGAVLSEGASEYRLQALDAADFPEPPEFGGEGELTLSMAEFRRAVDSVLYAVSTDQHRQVLTGVLMNYNGRELILVATDTHRLAVRKIAQAGIGTQISAVVPERALRAMKALPIADEENLTINFGKDRVGAEASGAKVVSQLLAGTYPNWERVVPPESTRTWSVEVDQLQEKVRRAMIIAAESASRVRFKGTDDQIIIAARSEERGEAKEQVAMIPTNGDMEIAFNGKYVLDALDPIEGPGLRVEMTENSRPAIFRPADDDTGYFCVIMPMLIS